MTPAERLATRLLGDVDVKRIVTDRVSPHHPEKDPTGGYVVYRKVAGGGGRGLKGRNRLQSYLFRVDCYAVTQDDADVLLAAVLACLKSWRERPAVQGCFDAEDQDSDMADDGGSGNFRVSGQTFELWCVG